MLKHRKAEFEDLPPAKWRRIDQTDSVSQPYSLIEFDFALN